jgi:hypothetical protein
LEDSYLQIATSASSWPETVFMFYAQTNTMVFAGISMSDANIRRWMAIANQIEKSDLEMVANTNKVTPKHLWFTTESDDLNLDKIKLVALIHLGVRPAWIESWKDLEEAINNLLGI